MASGTARPRPATADIPLATINALSAGNHTIYVRGKDAVGNWGGPPRPSLLIDKAAPTFTSVTLAPNPTIGATNVTLTVNGATDTGGAWRERRRVLDRPADDRGPGSGGAARSSAV